MAVGLDDYDKLLRFAWSDPKALAQGEELLSSGWFLADREPIDFDWYEPTTAWRRDNARWVEWFGGEKFGKAAPPVEGPNNPDRLRRELADAEADERAALGRRDEAEEEAEQAAERIRRLRWRLAARDAETSARSG
jgi:hypothetical protein